MSSSDRRKEVSTKDDVVVVEDEEKEKKAKPVDKSPIQKVKAAIIAKVGDKKPEKTKKDDSDQEESESILNKTTDVK
jgi:hypothetical protein